MRRATFKLPPSKALRLPTVGATLRWLGDRSSMVSSGGVLTQWRDRSSGAHHATPTGSPAATSAGIVFDGVDDRLDATVAITADQPVTIFVVASFNAGVTSGNLVELSDNGSSTRSCQFMRYSGYLTARQGVITETGDAFAADTATNMRALQANFSTSPARRNVLINGVWKGANGLPTSTVRSPTSMRIGATLGGILYLAGTIAAVAVYEGALTEKEASDIDRVMRKYASQSDPYEFPEAVASDTASDPKISLLDTLYGIVGRPITIWRDSVHYRDGYSPQSLTGSLSVDASYPDRWIITPPAAGTYSMTLAEGSYTKTFNVVVRSTLGVGDAAKKILCVGDSNTNRGGYGWIQYLGDMLAAKATFVGTVTPPAGFSYKHEGHDSFTWALFSGASSPFWHSGAIDLAWYRTQLTADPDIIVWFLFNSAELGAASSASLAYAEALKTAWDAQLPSCKHVFFTPLPGNGSPVPFGGKVARNLFRDSLNEGVRFMRTNLGGRTGERIYLANMTHAIDPVRGYVDDTIHHNTAPGGVQIAEAAYCALTGIWSL